MAKKRPTVKERKYMSKVASFACIACEKDGLDDIPNKKIPVIDCPMCGQANPITSDERPLRLTCGGCGRTLLIE